MPPERADAVICGAGVAGLAAAWRLAVRHGLRDVVIVDERPPLSLTSDKSTECYRNWWPDRPMVALMNRSIELLDELAAASGNAFALNRNGYLYLTATAAGAEALERSRARRHRAPARASCACARRRADDPVLHGPGLGPADAGPGRRRPLPRPGVVRRALPLRRSRRARRSPRPALRLALGAAARHALLEQARAAGARLVAASVIGVDVRDERVSGVRIARATGRDGSRPALFVNAAGPFVDDVARLVGRTTARAPRGAPQGLLRRPPRRRAATAPLVIWNDPVDGRLERRGARRARRRPATAPLLEPIPAGVHFRPEGGHAALRRSCSGTTTSSRSNAAFPARRPAPRAGRRARRRAHRARLRALPRGRPRPFVDGGYYTKTRENRPLVGPTGRAGSFPSSARSPATASWRRRRPQSSSPRTSAGAPLPGLGAAFPGGAPLRRPGLRRVARRARRRPALSPSHRTGQRPPMPNHAADGARANRIGATAGPRAPPGAAGLRRPFQESRMRSTRWHRLSAFPAHGPAPGSPPDLRATNETVPPPTGGSDAALAARHGGRARPRRRRPTLARVRAGERARLGLAPRRRARRPLRAAASSSTRACRSSRRPFPADGTRFAVAPQLGEIRVVGTGDLGEVARLDAEGVSARAIALSPKGDHLVAAGGDGRLRIWNVERKRLVVQWPGNSDELGSIAWSPNGQWIAAGGFVRDAAAGRPKGIVTLTRRSASKSVRSSRRRSSSARSASPPTPGCSRPAARGSAESLQSRGLEPARTCGSATATASRRSTGSPSRPTAPAARRRAATPSGSGDTEREQPSPRSPADPAPTARRQRRRVHPRRHAPRLGRSRSHPPPLGSRARRTARGPARPHGRLTGIVPLANGELVDLVGRRHRAALEPGADRG